MMDQTRIEKASAWLLRSGIFLTAVLATAGVIQVRNAAIALGYLDISSKWRTGTSLLFVIPGLFWLLAFLSLTRMQRFDNRVVNAARNFIARTGKGVWIIFLVCMGLFSFLSVGWQPSLTYGLFTRLFFLWIFGLGGYASLSGARLNINWQLRVLTTVLVFVVCFRIVNYMMGVSNYPFSLNWSETSNYFYSSLFLSQKIYGFSSPMPLINPARDLLGTIPLLLPAPQIWISRLWASLLWITCTGLTAYLVARRLRLSDRLFIILFTLWAFIFFLQGPIYYELLLSVAIVVWLFNGQRFWRSLLVVILASAWTGLCRVNWYPMPGIAAAMLFFLETPAAHAAWWRYLWRPAAWVAAGTTVAVAAFAGYNLISGNSTSWTAMVLDSPLLWYRLLPSGTNTLGVLPNVLLVASPCLVLIGLWFDRQASQWKTWRILGIFGILATFFAGGLVVSTKIGGGSNIHNLDAFWFLLLVLTSYLFFGRPANDQAGVLTAIRFPAILIAAIVALPVVMQLTVDSPKQLPGTNAVDEVLNKMNAYVSSAAKQGRDVLFIDNKQLLTFGYFPGARMVTDYETVFILENAMTGNKAYFEKFWQELKENRFAVIIAYPQPKLLQNVSESFAEENNAQITWIGEPLLCYYQETEIFLNLNVEIYTPRPGPVNCP